MLFCIGGNAMWPFSKKDGNISKGLPVINQMTDSLVRLHEVGNAGYALVGASVVAIIAFLIVAGLASKTFLASIVAIIPWIFGFVITFGSFGVLLLCIERIAALRLGEAKMRFIMSITEEAVKASLPKGERVDSAQVITIFEGVLAKLWQLEAPTPLKSPDNKGSQNLVKP